MSHRRRIAGEGGEVRVQASMQPLRIQLAISVQAQGETKYYFISKAEI